MKTGSVVMRLIAGVPVAAGFCLLQGCSMFGGSKPVEAPAVPVVPPEVVAPTNVVKVEPIPAPPVKEKAVLKPVPAMTTPYTVKAGESLSEIAAKYSKRWQDVLAVNPELSLKSHLRTGQTIQLPNPVDLAHPKKVVIKKKVEKKPEAAEKPAEGVAAAAPVAGETYVVKKGDSIGTVAAKHHVKRSDLEKANKLTSKSVLKVGQKLVIPGKAEAAAAPAETAPAATAPAAAPVAPAAPDAVPALPTGDAAAPAAPAAPGAAPAATAPAAAPAAPAAPVAETKTYTVKEGEDVYAVAIRWGVSPAELKALNNLTSSDLQPGQVLKIPAVAAPAP